MSSFNIRCARFLSAITVTILIGSAAAQRPSLRSEDPPDGGSSKQQSNGDFAVESFTPRGPVDPGAVISVTFNRDVITSEALEAGDYPESVFSFEPSIDGGVQWESLRQARFVPRRPLRQATEYIARINPLLRSVDGEQLAEPQEYTFQTPALSLRDAKQVRFLDDRRVVIALTFSDRVTPRDLRKHLSLHAGDQDIKWKPQSEVASAYSQIVTDPMTTDIVQLVIKPGLTGASGPLGIRNTIEKKVPLNFSLTAVSAKGLWRQGDPYLYVQFSSYVGSSGAEEFVTIEPPVDASFSGQGNNLVISGDFEPEKRYTINIGDGFKNPEGRMVVKAVKLSAWMPPMAPFLELPDSSGHLGTKSRMKLRVRSAAVNKITVTARRIFDNNLVYNALYRSGSGGMESLGRQVAKQTYNIPMTPNKAQTSEVDLRELLGPDATGIYGLTVKGETPSKELLTTSYTGEYSYEARRAARLEEHALINLSNLGIIAKDGEGEVHVFVAALDTAEPLPGINVSVFSSKNQPLGEATTDASGMAKLTGIAAGRDEAEPAVVIARTPDDKEVSVLNLDQSLMYREEFSSSGRDFLVEGYEAFVTSERGAYRPGETVHLSGFIRGRDAEVPASAFPVEVVLERPDGKKMTPQIKKPGARGLLTFDLTIPDYAPTGLYKLDVQMPGTGEGNENNGYDY